MTKTLEIELRAELEQPPGDGAARQQPLRAVGIVQAEDVGRVGEVVDIDVPLQPPAPGTEDLAQARIDLRSARLEHRARLDEGDRRRRVTCTRRGGTC